MVFELRLRLLIRLLTLLVFDDLSTTGEAPSSLGTSRLALTAPFLGGASPIEGELVATGNLVAGGSLDRSLR